MKLVKVGLPAVATALLLALGAGTLLGGRAEPPPAPVAAGPEATIETAVFAVG